MSFFPGCRGRIYHHRYLPDGDVHSAVVLLHEYGEHLGLYDALARRLAPPRIWSNSWAVVAGTGSWVLDPSRRPSRTSASARRHRSGSA